MLLAALIIGFLVMTQMSPVDEEDITVEAAHDAPEGLRVDTSKPVKTLESVEQRVEGLLQSSEDKYRDLDR